MDFGQQLERYFALKKEHDRYTWNRHEKSSPLAELYNIQKYLFDIYRSIRLNAGLDEGNQFDFETWVNNEFEQYNYIKNLVLEDNSNLDEPLGQIQDFDNLGFNSNFVIEWRDKIFKELESSGVLMTDFYFSDINKNNKDLLEHIVLKSETYNSLNNKGLINKGYCPITGENIGTSYSYNMYDRHIYLSKTGLEICKEVNRNDWNADNESKISYDEFEKLKKNNRGKSRKQASAVVFILVILSIFISWNIVSPTGFLSFLSFVLVGFVVFFILGWIFNFLWDFYLT